MTPFLREVLHFGYKLLFKKGILFDIDPEVIFVGKSFVDNFSSFFISLDNFIIVIGSFGSIKWDGIRGTVEFWKKDQGSWDELFKLKDLNDSYKYEWDDLGRSFSNNEEPLINGFDGLKTLSVLEEIKKSSQSEGVIMKIINQD